MLLVRMRSPRLPAMLLGFCSLFCSAQIAQRYTVTGTVVDSATNEPIRRALVALGGSLVFTGADGRFQAENVPAGPVQIAAQKPGYFECATRNCPYNHSPARAVITLHSGTNDVLLKLVPESRIEGRIVDEDGEPIGGVLVQALGEHIDEGQKSISGDGAASTDENGTYRIENLTPGTYRLESMGRPEFWSEPASESGARIFPPRFYPNSPDSSAAQVLDLRPGQTARADFTLTPVPSFRITGSVTPIVPALSINVQDQNGAALNSRVHVDPKSGKFSIGLVPAGTWLVDFSYSGPEGQSMSALETVTAPSPALKDLHVLLQPYAAIGLNIDNESTLVELVSTERSRRGAIFGQKGPRNPTNARVTDAPPGSYRVVVYPNGPECVDSITSGSLDLTREELVVAPGSQPQPINVVLRHDCASIEAGLHASNSNGQATVLLIPSSRAMQPMTIEIESQGTVSFNNLSPGDYQVYAFSNIDGLEYANPEVMRDFSGQKITLVPNQHANVTLDLISR